MEFINTLLIAIALAMDSFTVSISGGAYEKKINPNKILLVATYFGFFQFFMPILGWKGGSLFLNVISSYDHWIALGLLLFIGGKMILESFKQTEKKHFSFNHKLLFILALATSIDALGVGLSYAFLNKPIFIPSIVIGMTAFFFSAFGIYLGKFLKKILKNKAELAGGIILIGIGIHIAVQHGAFAFLYSPL